MTNRSAEALERIDEIAPIEPPPHPFDCAACGHRHRGMILAGEPLRNMDRCGYAAGWDGGAPTEFCDCKSLVPEYEVIEQGGQHA